MMLRSAGGIFAGCLETGLPGNFYANPAFLRPAHFCDPDLKWDNGMNVQATPSPKRRFEDRISQINMDHDAPTATRTFAGAEGGTENGVHFLAVFSVLRRRWPILAIALGAGASLAVIISVVADKTYTATAEILVTPNAQKIIDLETPALPTIETAVVDNQVGILKSVNLLGRLVDRYDLTRNTEFAPPPAQWAAWLRLAGNSPQKDAQTALYQKRFAAIRLLQDKIKVSRSGLSYLIDVAATTKSPALSAQLANGLVELYLAAQIQPQIDSSQRTANWIQGQVSELRQKLQVAEKTAEDYKAANHLVDAEGHTLTEQQRADLTTQLGLARADLAVAQSRLNRISDLGKSKGDLESMSAVLTSDTIVALRKQQAELAANEADLAERYDDKHPALRRVRAQMQDVQSQLRSEVRRIAGNIQNEAAVAQARVSSLTQTLSGLDSQAATNEQAAIHLRELNSEIETDRRLYEDMLQAARKSAALTNPDSVTQIARQTTVADIPVKPGFPNPPVLLALFGLLSLIFGIGVIILLEILDHGFRTVSSVRRQLGVPVLGMAPRISRRALKAARSSTLTGYLHANPTSPFAEALRKISTANLFSERPISGGRCVMISSALPDDGKTSLACCLAACLAAANMRVLLIDGDLRHPNVSRALGLPPRHSLTDFLRGHIVLKDAIQTGGSRLPDVLVGADKANDSANLLASDAMTALLSAARQKYDFVIIDSSPILPIADPLILAKKCDAVIFSIRWRKTPRAAARIAIDRLQETGARLAGAVLTIVDIDKIKRDSAAQGDDYYYYNSYRQYYSEPAE